MNGSSARTSRRGLRVALRTAISWSVLVACATSGGKAEDSPSLPPRPAPTADAAAPPSDAGRAPNDAGAPTEPTVSTSVITRTHRFVPGAMFGGWGPHLGHLLARAPTNETWFADDACEPPCDVNVNQRIDYFRFDAKGWTKATTQSLPATVQQNTASILANDTIFTYGVDVAGGRLVECTLGLASLAKACNPLPVTIGPSSNYIGAALAPDGTKVVWLTNVKDGGGGSFQWFANYGSGWNGPRTGDVGGFNDASYVHAAFGSGAHQGEMLLHAELVAGNAPAWTFVGAVGAIDIASSNAATFATSLVAPKAGDPVISTNDVAIDPTTNDAHLFGRTQSGDAVYYHRPPGGTWSGPLFTLTSTFRARLVFTRDGTLFVVYGPAGKGIAWRSVPAAARTPGKPVLFAEAAEHVATLPAGYGSIVAIYPQSSVYQSAPVTGLRIAVVGDTKEAEALFVAID